MKSYFIAGTGTSVGKTLFTCALARQLLEKKKKLLAVKPVISGFTGISESDTGELLAAQGMALSRENIDLISPWRFAAPISPDMAAEDEGKPIELEALVRFCQSRKAEYLLIESAGGILSPLGERYTMLDWAKALGSPVILVAGSYLGTISHTLASARAIAQARLVLESVVISESENSLVTLGRTAAALKRFLPENVEFKLISRLDSSAHIWKDVPDMTAGLL